MSVQFNWDKLLEDSETIESWIREFLHEQFQNIHLPPFIQSLSVSSFKLGSSPPEVVLRHFSDPFREFYEEYTNPPSPDSSPTSFSSRLSTPLDYRSPLRSTDTSRNLSSTTHRKTHPEHHQDLDTIESPMSLADVSDTMLDGEELQYDRAQSIVDNDHAQSDPYLDPPYESTEEAKGRPLDVQTLVEFKYSGDMQLAISATLLVNYPAPSFISLPLSIRVTGIEIHSLAVAAFIEPRIHLSVLCDVAGDGATPNEEVDVIRSMKIESEIGDNSDHGAVLRNVGKVEKFVLEQLRRVIREELVWPGWITLEL